MMTIRQGIERRFEQTASVLCRYRLLAIATVLLATLSAASGLRNISIDTSTASFLREGDGVLLRYKEFRDQFGRDDLVIIAAGSDTLFTPGTLRRIEAFTTSLRKMFRILPISLR